MRRFAECIGVLLGLLLAGLMFMLFSSVSYVPAGTVGAPNAGSVIGSILFCAALPLCFLLLGRSHAIGGYAALTLVFVHFLLIGALQRFGWTDADGIFSYLFYITAAPFAPLAESLIETFPIGGKIVYLRMLIPTAVYLFSMAAYLIAHADANRRAIEKHYKALRSQPTEE